MQKNIQATIFLMVTLVASAALAASAGNQGTWRSRVPEKERARQNPLANDPTAVAAGGKLFRQKCAKCHGAQGEGAGEHPPVNSERVRAASPGELQWLLNNGSLKHGMPSWSRLPEPQRWQIVAYLKMMAGSR
ncbi:MAG: cytochrome c [Acidobacteriota bacterium]|nr:cytochrome c [Acidobacteriota bacterium]